MECVFLLALLLGWPALSTLLALLREERVLGGLYWQIKIALDRRRR